MQVFAIIGLPALFAVYITMLFNRDVLKISTWRPFLAAFFQALIVFFIQWLLDRVYPVQTAGTGMYWNRLLLDFMLPWTLPGIFYCIRFFIMRRRDQWLVFITANALGHFAFLSILHLLWRLPVFYPYSVVLLPVIWGASVTALVFTLRLAAAAKGWRRYLLAVSWVPFVMLLMLSGHLFRLQYRGYGMMLLLSIFILLLAADIFLHLIRDKLNPEAANPGGNDSASDV